MTEGIYYYDETAPLTRSHNDILLYQRSDQTPATYLVELPGTLPAPPPGREARAGRREASIVQMDRQTSGTESMELEPLEAYVRTNLACFRKSLAPEDLKDARRAKGSALVDYKLADSRCTHAVVEPASKDSRKPTQDENPTDERVRRQTPPNVSLVGVEVLRMSQDTPAFERLRKAPSNATTTDSEIRKGPLDKTPENNVIPTSVLIETPGRNKIRKSLENPENERVRQRSLDETPGSNGTGNAPTNKVSKNEEKRKSNIDEYQDVKNTRQASLNENPVKKENVGNRPVIATPADKGARKEQRTTSFDPRPLNNEIGTPKKVINEKERNRVNQTAKPLLTDPGGPENGWEPKWDPLHVDRYRCPAKKRGSDSIHGGDMDVGARPRGRQVNYYPDSSRGRIPDLLYVSNLSGRSNEVTMQGRTFEESRLKVDLTVELLHDSRCENSRNTIHNNVDHTSPRSSENAKNIEKGCNSAGKERRKPNRRSWSANSRRESIDGSHRFENLSFNTCDAKQFPDLRKVGNGRLRGGANTHRRSRSASFMRMSKTFKGFRNTENSYPVDDLNLGITENIKARKETTSNKNNMHKSSRGNSLGESLKVNDVKNYYGRVYGGFDGNPKGQPSTKNKTSKPFSYDGMINCDIEDCPCRCHPDYDHASGGRPGIARDKDAPVKSGGKGYDQMYDGDPYSRGRPGDGKYRDYPGKGYDPYGKGGQKDRRDRDYPVKGYDPYYGGDLYDKGRPRDGKGPGKGYDPDGKGNIPSDGRDRDHPRIGYDPRYDADPYGKGTPRDERARGYPGSPTRKGYDTQYDGDLDGKGRPRNGKDMAYPGKGYDPLFDGFDDKTRPRDNRDGDPLGKSVGFRPGDRSPFRGDPTQGDGRNAREDKDGRGKGVLKQRVPKTATSLFTFKRYHIKIPDHDLKDPWFNARFSINKDKNVDLKYQGPVKINNYYTSNRYE